MSTAGLRKCRHCGVWFKPEARSRKRQRYCREPLCRRASKKASQEKWHRKNPGYFRGDGHVNRVRQWRAQHPGYWRKAVAQRATGPPDALQDLLISQGFDVQGVRSFRICMSDEISRPLQDLLSAQGHALVGLTAMISGEALQEDIARVLDSCYHRGQRMDGMVPWMQRAEVADERQRTYRSGSTAACAGPVQLG
jgi:hypothetical protein